MAFKMRLGEYLVSMGYMTQDQVDSSLSMAKDKNIKLGKAVLMNFPEKEPHVYTHLADQLSMSLIPDPKPDPKFEEEVLSYIPKSKLKELRVYPLRKDFQFNSIRVFFISDDACNDIVDLVKTKHPTYKVEVLLTYPSVINGFVGGGSDYNEFRISEIGQESESVWNMFEEAEKSDDGNTVTTNVVKIVNAAQKKGASDIHISPEANCTKVRFRIDGVLVEERSFGSKEVARRFASRIMNLAKLEQSDFINPQDGSLPVKVSEDKTINLRVSILPSIHGANTVIRILDASNAPIDLTALKFSKGNMTKILDMTERSQGIILITGPTGSGKSTTLYSAINRMNTGDVNIITIEDPVERPLDGIVQVQINPKSTVDFTAVLKSTLRQDPDVILIGEIRDSETARISVQAANTGHLVLSTLHTNSAASTITRFIDMGVLPYQVADSLVGVVNQRLVRKVCSKCAVEKTLDNEKIANALGLELGTKYVEGVGCKFCNAGYKGRVGIHEVLVVNDALRHALNAGETRDIEKLAIDGGMITLVQDGVQKILEGLTTPFEVMKHTRAH